MTDDFDPSLAQSIDTQVTAPERKMMIASLIVNGALFLAAAFIAGLVLGDHLTMILALLSMGIAYLSAFYQVSFDQSTSTARVISLALVLLSITSGVAAFLTLVWP